MRLYSELADWFHLLTAPEDYAEEAAEIVQLAEAAGEGELRTLLELGSGGGNNASHLKPRFECTLTDVSEEMLEVSRGAEPGVRAHRGRHADAPARAHRSTSCSSTMRSSYMTTEADLRAAFETAFAHTRPGGVAIFHARLHAGDARRARRATAATTATAARCVTWSGRATRIPPTATYEVDYVVVLREGDAPLRVDHDTMSRACSRATSGSRGSGRRVPGYVGARQRRRRPRRTGPRSSRRRPA